jgi:hypothetical protein
VTAANTDELRDRLTCAHLSTAAAAPATAEVREYRRRWWDGAARVPALVVEVEGAGRCRLVEAGGQVIALPAGSWRARRAIRRLRRRANLDPRLLALARGNLDPRRESEPRVSVVRQRTDDLPVGRPTMPLPRFDRPRPVVRIDQDDDVVRCSSRNCSALVPIPPPGRLLGDATCPRCGRTALPAPPRDRMIIAI